MPKHVSENSKRLEAPPDFRGPVKRKCTDVVFMILLFASWIGMSIIGYSALMNGNPAELINGIDYNGNICGFDAAVADHPDFYYIRFDGVGVCVTDCPNETDFNTLYACIGEDSQYALGGVNQLNCLGADAEQCAQLTGITDTSTFEGAGNGMCMYQIESIDFLNHCLFTDSMVSSFFTTFKDEYSYIQQFLTDIYTAKFWILGFGFVFSFAMGFLYCLLLRVPGVVSTLIWGSILLTFSLFVALGIGCWALASDWDIEIDGSYTDDQITAAKISGIVFFVVALLFACLSLFMYRRIRLATMIIKEAARAISRIPIMVLMPIFEAIGIVLFFIPLVYYGVYVASMGDIETVEDDGLSVKEIEFSDEIEAQFWYLLFCLFWTTQFIVAMGQIIIALTIVSYYFTRDKSKVSSLTFLKSFANGMIFHVGTAAFGALLISIVSMIRSGLMYVEQHLHASGNKVMEAIICCCQCCFWCVEKCIQFISKNAYIQTALFSTGFCKSAKEAFYLIARNILRVGAVDAVSEFMVVIMKLTICLSTMGATYLCLIYTISDELYSLMGPIVFVGTLAYMVSSVFAELFNMATSTLLQCFIADEEMFHEHERHSTKDLKEFMHQHCNETESSDTKKHRLLPGTS